MLWEGIMDDKLNTNLESTNSMVPILVEEYKIPAKKWGYHHSHIGIETKRQKLFWRDEGIQLIFLGILDNTSVHHPNPAPVVSSA